MSFLYSKLGLPRPQHHRWAIDAAIDAAATTTVIATRHGHSQGPKKGNSSPGKRGGGTVRWRNRQEKDPYVIWAQKLNVPSRAYFKLEELDKIHHPSLQRKKYAKKKSKQREPMSLRKRSLVEPGMLVLDLGAAPGGWSLYASGQLSSKMGGGLVAVDLLSLEETLQSDKTDTLARIQSNLEHFEFIQGGFTEQETQSRILDAFSSVSGSETPTLHASNPTPATRKPSLIMSDMAPNFMGNQQIDALRTMNLCEQALAFAAGPDCFDESLERNGRASGLLDSGGDFLCKFFKCGEDNERELLEAAKRSFEHIGVIKPKASRRESSEQYLMALNYRY